MYHQFSQLIVKHCPVWPPVSLTAVCCPHRQTQLLFFHTVQIRASMWAGCRLARWCAWRLDSQVMFERLGQMGKPVFVLGNLLCFQIIRDFLIWRTIIFAFLHFDGQHWKQNPRSTLFFFFFTFTDFPLLSTTSSPSPRIKWKLFIQQ